MHDKSPQDLSQYYLTYSDKNHIKALDSNGFTQNKITLIDLSNNKIASLKNILSESAQFSALKVLNASKILLMQIII